MERTVKKYPRRPPNAFFLFSNENRRKLIGENPGLGNRDISRMLGTLWSQLESDKKQEFIKKSEEIQAKHLKEFPGYKFNPWTARRLRESQEKRISAYKQNSSNHLIIWRPTTALQMSLRTDLPPESQTNCQSVRPEVELISEEKRTFFGYLGLCQRNSAEYFNIEAKLALNARKYIFSFIQMVNNRANYKTQTGKEDQNKGKRPRGRPRKYWPKIIVQTNQLNED